MNTRSHNLQLRVAPNQADEVTKAVFHTVLLHRSTGKYMYSPHQTSTFSVGTVGTEDVDCSTVDFTYVRCDSPELDNWLSSQIKGFSTSLCNQQGPSHSGKLKLEFYERKKGRWLMPAEVSNWEVWNLQLDLIQPRSDADFEQQQQSLVEALSETVLFISQMVNRHDYLPRNPPQDDLANVFDTNFSTVQPFLHRVTFELGGESVAGSVRKFIRDTFAYNY